MLRTARLLEQLHACEPVDSLEDGHRAAMQQLLSSSPGAFSRTSHPGAIAIDRAESNDLAWVSLDRAAVLMPGQESQRVLRKIEVLLSGRSTQ